MNCPHPEVRKGAVLLNDKDNNGKQVKLDADYCLACGEEVKNGRTSN